jgi:hypothetical protein
MVEEEPVGCPEQTAATQDAKRADHSNPTQSGIATMTTYLNNVSILLDRAKRHDCTLSAGEQSAFNKLHEIDSEIESIYNEPLEGEDDPTIVEHWTRFGPEVAYHDTHRAVAVALAIGRGVTSLDLLTDVCTREIGIHAMRSNWEEEGYGPVEGDPTEFLNSCLVLHKALGENWPIKAYKLWGTLAANWDHDDEQYVDEWEGKCRSYGKQRAYEASVVRRYLEAQAA